MCVLTVKKMTRVAITGSIGSGKSKASSYLRTLGYPLFDVDACNAEVLQKETTKQQLIAVFGKHVIQGGSVDKTVLRAAMLADASLRLQLEAIVLPQILSELQAFFTLHEKETLVFAEVPTLFEQGWDVYFDAVWVVVVEEALLLNRLTTQRGVDQTVAKAMLALQFPVAVKKERATLTLDNGGSEADLFAQIDRALGRAR
ncbi:MAG: dephospho-CoA kinase [Erysipelotrichaceae bacterium]